MENTKGKPGAKKKDWIDGKTQFTFSVKNKILKNIYGGSLEEVRADVGRFLDSRKRKINKLT